MSSPGRGEGMGGIEVLDKRDAELYDVGGAVSQLLHKQL